MRLYSKRAGYGKTDFCHARTRVLTAIGRLNFSSSSSSLAARYGKSFPPPLDTFRSFPFFVTTTTTRTLRRPPDVDIWVFLSIDRNLPHIAGCRFLLSLLQNYAPTIRNIEILLLFIALMLRALLVVHLNC